MRCPRCGTENQPGKIVCRSCGLRLRVQAQAQSGASAAAWTEEAVIHWARRDLIRVCIILASLVAMGAVLGLLLR